MRISNFIQTRMAIHSKAKDFSLGKGVKLYTDKVCDAMILFLADRYDHYAKYGITCLKGDIGSLFARKAEIDKKRINDNTTYQQHLEQMYGQQTTE